MEEQFEREERLSYDPYTTSDAFGPLGNLLLKVSRWFALAGGLIFVALVLMQLVSVVGRKLFSFAVPGDVEVLQMCAAIAGSTFFAYCHLIQGDVKVDFFTHNMTPWKIAFLDSFGSLMVGLFGAISGPLHASGNATVTVAHTRSRDLPALVGSADILIAAAGSARLVRGEWLRPGATVVDVGMHRVPAPNSAPGTRLVGDVDFDAVKEKVLKPDSPQKPAGDAEKNENLEPTLELGISLATVATMLQTNQPCAKRRPQACCWTMTRTARTAKTESSPRLPVAIPSVSPVTVSTRHQPAPGDSARSGRMTK